MAGYISQSEFARQCGVTRQAISKALKGGFAAKTVRGIDPEHPTNQYFKAKALTRKALLEVPKEPNKKGKKVPPKKVPVRVSPPEKPEQKVYSEGGPRPKAQAEEATFDLFQKAYEDTRLKKIKADIAVIDYAEKIGAVVDIETLKQKMNAFSSFLFTHLVYLPENIAVDLWMSARAADDPERKIREMLSKSIDTLIKEAKVAAAEVLPPNHGVKYVMLGLEEDEEE